MMIAGLVEVEEAGVRFKSEIGRARVGARDESPLSWIEGCEVTSDLLSEDGGARGFS